jgi:hypothetical protein
MEIQVKKSYIVTAATAAVLSVVGWFTLETYNHAQRLSALEQHISMDVRQDRELQELRASMQDLIVLFFQESVDSNINDIPKFVPDYPNAAPDDGFSAAQTDLRGLLEVRGEIGSFHERDNNE